MRQTFKNVETPNNFAKQTVEFSKVNELNFQ